MKRAGVLISGSGSNLQALIDACASPGYPARIAVVISNVATAFGLERAKKAGLPTVVVDHKAFSNRAAFEATLAETLAAHQVEIVCLAGFMRLLGPAFLSRFPGAVLNIHPALLPAFPGMHGPRQALAHGVKVAGCTVHFVDQGTDSGPIVAQAAVPVLPGDDEAALAARILAQEHLLYPAALKAVAEGRAVVDGRSVRLDAKPAGEFVRNPGT